MTGTARAQGLSDPRSSRRCPQRGLSASARLAGRYAGDFVNHRARR